VTENSEVENIICIVCLACDCLGENVNLEPEDVSLVHDDDSIVTEPEVESVENNERVSEKFGGVAGVLAGVMKVRDEPED
jgi:hypothetical protein